KKLYKNFCLLIFSLLFYSWGEPKYIILMITSILVDYCISQRICREDGNRSRQKILLATSIIFNIGMLFIFKYYNFITENINYIFKCNIPLSSMTLPIGISFYTFQTLSYTIDVYTGKIKPEKNIINFASFVTMFPQLIAGPIVKYTDIKENLIHRKNDWKLVEEGIEDFIVGLGKKVLLANNFGMLWEEAQAIGFVNISTPMAWLSLLAFSLQIYYDFSGYSTMAIGLGKMLGFIFPKNFNYPYISRSISEFWRRWHITLGSWFKEYIYIPIGGNRKGIKHTFFNLLVVWFLTGLWHGAELNFILWGLYFFVLISLEKLILGKYLNKHNIFSHIYTIFMLLVGWAVFAITDLNSLKIFINKLFIFKYNTEWIYYMQNYLIIIIIGIICCTPVISSIWNRLKEKKYICTLILIVIFIICIGYLVDASYNPFLYFRF
ncbi:MAG: MBOAT family protein, partial [Clostridium sp.]|nr:MBOAT family protein [Clostridium sp.]